MSLPNWAEKLISLYASTAANQFLLFGNVNDRFVLEGKTLGSLYEFLSRVMLPRFDVILSYDLGNGVRIDKGGEIVQKWPGYRETPELPPAPRAATEWLTRFFRYCANLTRLGQDCYQIGFYMKAAHLVAPALPGALNYDLNALALLMRDWAADDQLARHSLATFLISDNLHDLHPLIVTNPRAAAIEVPIPSSDELREAITLLSKDHAPALAEFAPAYDSLAAQLTGTTLTSVENLLRTRTYERQPLHAHDLVDMRKELVERDSAGLFVFIDEADQSLGKREAGSSDSGLSGRIYGMFAEQMSNPANRGRIVWILASSRPDLIEVDLKRPGRVDVKIPIFPTTNPTESFALIRALSKRRGIELNDADFAAIEPMIPTLLTPGAAEAIAVKLYRSVKTANCSAQEALRDTLDGYQNPVPADVMQFQIAIAAREASDGDFVPEAFRSLR